MPALLRQDVEAAMAPHLRCCVADVRLASMCSTVIHDDSGACTREQYKPALCYCIRSHGISVTQVCGKVAADILLLKF
jgi:hypothetical protein